MPTLRLISLATLFALATGASASSLVASTDALVAASMNITEATSDASSSLNDDKIVRAARDDAASFVASQGVMRGARLEAALQHIRLQAPQLQGSDLQLAEAILAH